MAYKNIKLVEYAPSGHSNEDLLQAQARKVHYESEVLRIQAAELIQKAKDVGKPIQVQGNQND